MSELLKGRALGVGGIFFRSKDPVSLGAWYAEHLGLEVEVLEDREEYDFGKFADPDGNRVELWEPPEKA